MNLAVMQPYLFPYIGYFQLIYASDFFLIYDDVNYIKQGYINRNTILASGNPIRFTVSVPGASSNKKISSLAFSIDVEKVLKTIFQSYSKAPYFQSAYPLVEKVLTSSDRNIGSVCLSCYESVFEYLGIEKKFSKTSELDYDRSLPARDRLFTFCYRFNADCYINAPGGKSLYSKSEFKSNGLDLRFIHTLPVEYRQSGTAFVPNLSMIDVLMHCSPEEVKCNLRKFELE